MKKILGINHRADGVFGYQLENGLYKAILQSPKGLISNPKVMWGDPYNWHPVGDEYKWVCDHEEKYTKCESDEIYDYFTFELDSKEQRFKYFFVFEMENQKVAYGEFGTRIFKGLNEFNYHSNFAFTWNYSSIGKFSGPKSWWNKTNWYQVFPDRFANDQKELKRLTENYNEKMGGNIKGVISKLDYIKDLGFNGIYLNPIFKSSSDHKYDTENYFEIDPDFGTMEDFKNLIKEVKSRNMKIMLDGVFNHCGADFPQWKDVVKNKQKSEFADWFMVWDWDNLKEASEYENTNFAIAGDSKAYSTFGNTPYMPRFNWANKGVADFIKSVIRFWTDKGIDVWRMDVADEVSFEMWRQIRNEIKSVNPDVMLLGEVWYDALVFLHGDQFDSSMNYPFRLNTFDYFVNETIDSEKFVNNIISNKYKYSEFINMGLFNLVGSHDTNRLFDECNKDELKTRMVLAWLLLSNGTLSFYYGDEINLIGNTSRENREPFNWEFDKNDKTYKLVKRLMNFRNKNIDTIKSERKVSTRNGKIIIEFINGKTIEFDKDNHHLKIYGELISLI